MLVITRQIKAARSLLGWEQFELSKQAGVGISTIRRLEGSKCAISAQLETIEKLRAAFENAGIEFYGDPCPGVRLTSKGREPIAPLEQVALNISVAGRYGRNQSSDDRIRVIRKKGYGEV
jgi:transcriptional regulator with XRE-family HTH domain